MSAILELTASLKDYIVNRNKKILQRALAYLFERNLGEYTNIGHDQLDTKLDWTRQEFTVKDVELKPKAVTAALADFPCEVIEGYIGHLTTSIPWKELSSAPTTISVKDVDITLRPKAPVNKAAQLLDVMSSSMMHSMESSKRFAEEAIGTQKLSTPDDNSASPGNSKIEAVEWMAGCLENIKAMAHVVVENITLRLEMVEDDKLSGLEIHIEKLEFFDDQVKKREEDTNVDWESEGNESGHRGAWLTKNIHIMGITVSLDDHPVPFTPTSMQDSTGTSPAEQLFVSALEEPVGDQDENSQPQATPITIASVVGKAEVKVKMKSNESVEGPKVDIAGLLGAVHALLSPKQLEMLTRIVSSFTSPPESGSDSSSKRVVNKRMGPEDYEKVGQVLQQDMQGHFEDIRETFTEDCDLSASGERRFYTMESHPLLTAGNLSASTCSLDSAGAMSIRTSTESETSKQKEKTSQKVSESAARAASDPTAERSHYQATVATVSVCLLHEEPGDGKDGISWSSKMEALSKAYFLGARRVTTVGQIMSLAELRNNISAIVPRDHLGLLMKPVFMSMADRTVHNVHSVKVETTFHQAELVECLIPPGQVSSRFSDQEPVPVPQYCEILTFNNAQGRPSADVHAVTGSFGTPVPAVHLSAEINSKTGSFGYTQKDTKISVELGNMVTELDITILDRLNTVFTTMSKPKRSSSHCIQPLLSMDGTCGFDEAMQDVAQNYGAVDFSATCPHVTVRVRFPIPDLRPSLEIPWGRDLHSESLLLEFDQVSFHRYDKAENAASAPTSTEVLCHKLDVYLQEDINKPPILFGSIQQGTGDIGDNFNLPRVVIKSFPPSGTPLDALQEGSLTDSQSWGFGGMDETQVQESPRGSSPFSRRKEILHGTTAFESDDQEGFDNTFERVSPGNKEEMREFMDVSASNTSLLVEITAPKLLVMLHNKQFLELLYNRLNNDLLLWQPRAPSPPEAFPSGSSLNVQPFATMSSMSQSCYGGLPDSDSDEESPPISNQLHVQPAKYRLPSDLCLSVNIGDGKVFATVPVREEDSTEREGVHGELAVLGKDASLFVSVGHEGNKDLRYVTFGANRAQLLHAGCVSNNKPPIRMEHLDTLTFDSCHHFEHMHNLIYRSEPSVPITPLTDVGTGDVSEDMVAVAIEIKVDNFNNNKYFCVGAEVRGGTLRHNKYPTGEGWIQQVIDLVDLTDYPVKGYVMPKALTDLHIGLTGCAVDYRPRNFELVPLRSLLSVQKFNLAVNLNAETKYTSIKFLLEEAQMWLSDRDLKEVDVHQDYICLSRVALLEVGLRLGAPKQGGTDTLLWLGNNKTEFHMCSDSCSAFIHLLDHFMQDRDLEIGEAAGGEAEGQSVVNLEERTPAQNQHVEKMLSEALMDFASPEDSAVSPEELQRGSRPLYFMAEEGMDQQGMWLDEDPSSGLTEITNYFEDEAEEEGSPDMSSFDVIEPPKPSATAPTPDSFVMKWHVDPNQTDGAFSGIAQNFLSNPLSYNPAQDLKTPAKFPQPEFKAVLRELNLDICIYGGYDFATNKARKEERQAKQEDLLRPTRDAGRKPPRDCWKGGPKRMHHAMVKLTLNKLRMQYEKYEEHEEKARRLVVVIRRLEIEDRLAVSAYNKFLYWPHYETCEGVNMMCVKVMWERPDPRYNTEECSVRLTHQPVKLHVNQNTLMFIQAFFTHLSEDSMENPTATGREPSPSPSHTPRRKKSTSTERAPIFSTEGVEEEEEGQLDPDENLMHFSESSSSTEDTKAKPARPPRINVEPEGNPIFFKSFVMTRPVLITVDYTGTGAGMTMTDMANLATTALQGVLQLQDMKLYLKNVECNKGYLGVSKLLEALLSEWGNDIRTRQIGAVVGGIGPFSIFRNLVMGIRDFIVLPYEQYQRDGRVWRGFQKGALSLKSATQTAFLDLLKKFIESIMICSELFFDFLSSGRSVRSFRSRSITRQPRDIREGMSRAMEVFQEGFAGTFTEFVKDVSHQQEQKGLPGAVGYVVKTIPAAMMVPVTVLSAGADQCVTGIRNEVRPELVKETELKYKQDE